MNMPGLSGKELTARARVVAPKLRVLFVSGYSPRAATRMGAVSSGDPILPKPFTPPEILEAVRKALES
jgi:CheY-like chemotaxis protein